MLHPSGLDYRNHGIGADVVVWKVACSRDDVGEAGYVQRLVGITVDNDLAIVQA